MVLKTINMLEHGDVLLEDVMTRRGSILFRKGVVITDRVIEILEAFMIREVSVATKPNNQEQQMLDEDGQSSNHAFSNSFEESYNKLLQVMQRAFMNTSVAEDLPIVEMRSYLEEMIPNFRQQDLLLLPNNRMLTQDYIYHKSIMVALISYMIASWANFQQRDLMPVALAGLLHDIGNMEIDADILNKSGKLTPAEMEEVKKHTIIGYNRLKPVLGINDGVKLAALQHHEREDGSGYPLGLKGDKIHQYAKVVAIADIFYAMTRDRKYQKARSPYEVLEQLITDSFGKLDPLLVQNFVYNLTQHQLGYTVRLSNGSIGKIVYSDRQNPTRPWIDVKGKIINLAQERSLYIRDIISSKVD